MYVRSDNHHSRACAFLNAGNGSYTIEVRLPAISNLELRASLQRMQHAFNPPDDRTFLPGPVIPGVQTSDAYATTPQSLIFTGSDLTLFRLRLESIGQSASSSAVGYTFPAYGSMVSGSHSTRKSEQSEHGRKPLLSSR